MFVALVIVHVLVSVSLIFVVLLQSGKGAELGAAFGGVGQSTFGRSQATFITKFTTGMAVIFMATSLSLAFLTVEHPTGSVMTTPAAATAPAEEQTAEGTLATPPEQPQADAPVESAAQSAAEPAPTLPQTDAPPPSPQNNQ